MSEASHPAQAFFPLPPEVSGQLPGPAEAWQARPYPQLLRGPNHAWWRPLLSTAVVGACLLMAVIAFGLVMLVAMGADGTVDEARLSAWEISPTGLLLTNLTLALMIPTAQAAVWVGHGWRPRWVASVLGGVRWGWLARCYLLSLAVLLVINLALIGIDGGMDLAPDRQAGLYALVVLTTTPLQAAGEEYLFRGWLSQAVGSLIPSKVVGAVAAAVVSGLLFAFAHGQQDGWLFTDRFLFALVASWLVWRTGGLEAPIALHGAYNLVALALGVLYGRLDDLVTATEADALTVGINALVMLGSAFALDRLARRTGVLRLFRPPGVA
jgi:membrane protease YdiL (CAAX protease family)